MYCKESECLRTYNYLSNRGRSLSLSEAKDFDIRCHQCYIETIENTRFNAQVLDTSMRAQRVHQNIKLRTPKMLLEKQG